MTIYVQTSGSSYTATKDTSDPRGHTYDSGGNAGLTGDTFKKWAARSAINYLTWDGTERVMVDGVDVGSSDDIKAGLYGQAPLPSTKPPIVLPHDPLIDDKKGIDPKVIIIAVIAFILLSRS